MKHAVAAIFLVSFLAVHPAAAAPTTQAVLVVGIESSPPFAIKQADGTWSGIGVELWRTAAAHLGVQYRFREMSDLDQMLQGVADHSLDAAVSSITITADRERTLDFTQPYFVTGLGIAVPNQQSIAWFDVLFHFFSLSFLEVVATVAAALFVVAILIWLLERGRNSQHFAKSPLRGVGAGFWWAAVTMTAVGYGDKAPASFCGRLLAIVWMFCGVIAISAFTAAVTSSVTFNRLSGLVSGPDDLHKARLGTIRYGTSADYLRNHHLAFTSFDDTLHALTALHEGRLDAVVFDEPILRYRINRSFAGTLRVLPAIFQQQYYGIALPLHSPLREPLDREILRQVNSSHWSAMVESYLGK